MNNELYYVLKIAPKLQQKVGMYIDHLFVFNNIPTANTVRQGLGEILAKAYFCREKEILGTTTMPFLEFVIEQITDQSQGIYGSLTLVQEHKRVLFNWLDQRQIPYHFGSSPTDYTLALMQIEERMQQRFVQYQHLSPM